MTTTPAPSARTRPLRFLSNGRQVSGATTRSASQDFQGLDKPEALRTADQRGIHHATAQHPQRGRDRMSEEEQAEVVPKTGPRIPRATLTWLAGALGITRGTVNTFVRRKPSRNNRHLPRSPRTRDANPDDAPRAIAGPVHGQPGLGEGLRRLNGEDAEAIQHRGAPGVDEEPRVRSRDRSTDGDLHRRRNRHIRETGHRSAQVRNDRPQAMPKTCRRHVPARIAPRSRHDHPFRAHGFPAPRPNSSPSCMRSPTVLKWSQASTALLGMVTS